MDPKHLIALHVSTKEILRHSLLADLRPTHQFKLEEVTDASCDRAMLLVDAVRRDVFTVDRGCLPAFARDDYDLIVSELLRDSLCCTDGYRSHVASSATQGGDIASKSSGI